VQLACEIYNYYADVDEVWFVPCGDGRGDKSLRTAAIHRLNMMELILKDIIDVSVPIKVKLKIYFVLYQISDIEIKNNKYLPTWNLLQLLHEQYPNYKFLFCLGTDLIDSLDEWDNSEQLKNEVNFLILQRPEYNPDSSNFPKNYRVLKTHTDGSSTKIRNRIQQQIETQNKINLGISGLTTISVINYIMQNHLYHRD